jgi:hypothetical protein
MVNNTYQVFAARYAASAGVWGPAIPLETTNMAPGRIDQFPWPRVAADAKGNVQVVWRRKLDNTTFGVWARRYAVGGGWEPEQKLHSKPNLNAITGGAVADNGLGMTAFVYINPPAGGDPDAYNIFAALYR